MSVREAMEQTLVSLKHGRHVSGLDTSLQGEHSTDGKRWTINSCDVILIILHFSTTRGITVFSWQ